jgi:hypothetical protein
MDRVSPWAYVAVIVLLAFTVFFSVTGCGRNTASSVTPSPNVTSVSYAEAGRVCAALNAMDAAAYSRAAAWESVADALNLTIGQVIQATAERCPEL